MAGNSSIARHPDGRGCCNDLDARTTDEKSSDRRGCLVLFGVHCQFFFMLSGMTIMTISDGGDPALEARNGEVRMFGS